MIVNWLYIVSDLFTGAILEGKSNGAMPFAAFLGFELKDNASNGHCVLQKNKRNQAKKTYI